MKFEEFLMQRSEKQQKRRDLEDEVARLKDDLGKEQQLNIVLQCALYEPVISRPCLSSWLPLQVQMLLAEVTIVEQEIICLERKLEELKMCVYQEKKQTREWQMCQQQQQLNQQKVQKQKHHRSRRKYRNQESSSGLSFSTEDFRSQRWSTERRASIGSASEATSSTQLNDTVMERTISQQSGKQRLIGNKNSTEDPNRLSEDLINCLIGIFLNLNQPLPLPEIDCQVSATVPKLGLSCINSKGLGSKTSFNCKVPMVLSDIDTASLDPYGILTDIDGTVREIGPYKNFLQLSRSSLDMNHLPECFPAIRKLRVLVHKLSAVDLSFLKYKQKLAFWINTYNACIMHAYLQHGLPSSIDKQLALMNKAVLNVGGLVLNALAIEHFILRHPYDSRNMCRQGVIEVKERILWHAYGLGYPEPNVTFALCRGSWSSPALRVYTAKNVIDELGKAKAEYLEASVGVTSKKKILVPKLLHWHMQDFAENLESLLEWIYSQLPRSGSVNRLIMGCLSGEVKTPVTKIVQIQPYESEFRYLLPQ